MSVAIGVHVLALAVAALVVVLSVRHRDRPGAWALSVVALLYAGGSFVRLMSDETAWGFSDLLGMGETVAAVALVYLASVVPQRRRWIAAGPQGSLVFLIVAILFVLLVNAVELILYPLLDMLVMFGAFTFAAWSWSGAAISEPDERTQRLLLIVSVVPFVPYWFVGQFGVLYLAPFGAILLGVLQSGGAPPWKRVLVALSIIAILGMVGSGVALMWLSWEVKLLLWMLFMWLQIPLVVSTVWLVLVALLVVREPLGLAVPDDAETAGSTEIHEWVIPLDSDIN